MPIYEYYCEDCHTVYSFFSRKIVTDRAPRCPKCGRDELRRRPSTFAISRQRSATSDSDETDGDEHRLEQAMSALAGEMDGVDENNPRQMAGLMRKLYDATGMKLGAGMEEMIRRIEAGEDADAVEEELGDAVLEEDPFSGDPGAALRTLRRRHSPPKTDPTLYDFE